MLASASSITASGVTGGVSDVLSLTPCSVAFAVVVVVAVVVAAAAVSVAVVEVVLVASMA